MPLQDIIIGRDSEDLKKFGDRGTILLGRHIVGKGEDAHLTNPVRMDVARPHVTLIVGKRGQGKSYTGAVMAEEILRLPEDIKKNLAVVMIDTMGVFWSMKSPNEQQLSVLQDWGLKPEGFPVSVLIPAGHVSRFRSADIPYDGTFAIRPSELSAEDWALSFGLSLIEPIGILLERAVKKMSGKDFSIDQIMDAIESDAKSEKKDKDALSNRFLAAKEWGIFSEKGFAIEDVIKPGSVSIVDLSFFSEISEGWSVRSLMVGLLSRRIYSARIAARRAEEISTISGLRKQEVPITWIIIDEAHQFLPAEGATAASSSLLTLVKQGRQPGISLVLITQRPNKLHEDAISQADLVIAHRLTAKPDIEALRNIMQTYLMFDLQKYLTELPKDKGSAVILDDNSERLYSLQVRPKLSWHAGGTPTAIPEKKRF